ncbi:MAG: hypothetical protein ABJB66_10200, partial [Gemmatimonadaceae bacterium]
YGASVGGGCTRVPQQRYSLQMRYGSSPENVDKLSKSVFASIDSVSKTGPAQSDLDKVKEALLRSHEVDVKTNQYWISSIPLLKLTGEDYSKLTDGYNATVKSLTVEQLRDAARKYLDITNYARFVLLPQNPKPVP